ncbi:MDR family MFS transporter [Agrococcus sp. DT81.2]|uniref:MDR family MFS transporter n=1 Tax=Agrococcus sp. DT81.2 TaxID=3393414 RepID=UPI003CE538ED
MTHPHPTVDELGVDNLDGNEVTGDPERVAPRRVGLTIGILVVSAFMMILNETVLSVALPPIMADFGITAEHGQWFTTGFLLTMAVVIPTTGFLIQRFTTRALFGAALALFALGSLLAALAPGFELLLLGRIVQAGGTAIILPLLMTTTLTSVPPQHRGTMLGLTSVVISVAPAIGPTVSGIVVDSWSWHTLFWIMGAAAVVALVVGLPAIRTGGETRRVPLDLLSVLLSLVAFGGIVYGLATAGATLRGDWTGPVALGIGLVVLVAFATRQVRLQRRSDGALLDLRPFRVRDFSVSVVVVMMAMATMLGTVIVLPIHLQSAMGLSVLTTGLVMLPGGLVQGILSPFVGRISDKVGPRPLVIPGAVLLAGGQWWSSTITATTDLAVVIAMNVTFCVGMALIMTPLMSAALGGLEPRFYGHGSAVMNTLQQLAGAAGTAVLVAAMGIGVAAAASSGLAPADAQSSGTQLAFTVGGVLGVVAIIAAPFVRGAKRTSVVAA